MAERNKKNIKESKTMSNKYQHFDTKEESEVAMLKAAKFKKGDKLLVCRDDNKDTCYYKDDLWPAEKYHAGQVFHIIGVTTHTGTWSGTWKYGVGKTRKPWGAISNTYIDFGAASKPGKCSSCAHRLTRLSGGPGACPGIYQAKEEENSD